jgi:hypothetical protein
VRECMSPEPYLIRSHCASGLNFKTWYLFHRSEPRGLAALADLRLHGASLSPMSVLISAVVVPDRSQTIVAFGRSRAVRRIACRFPATDCPTDRAKSGRWWKADGGRPEPRVGARQARTRRRRSRLDLQRYSALPSPQRDSLPNQRDSLLKRSGRHGRQPEFHASRCTKRTRTHTRSRLRRSGSGAPMDLRSQSAS